MTLTDKIRSGDEQAFKEMFGLYYASLCNFSNSYVKSMDAARDIVQEVYVNIWENRENLYIKQSLKSYLYQAVRNRSINYLEKRDQLQKFKMELSILKNERTEKDEDEMINDDLIDRIWEAVEELPERRKSVFILYRKHGLSYEEIGEVMDISTKTVENQLSKALKHLREKLMPVKNLLTA